MPVLLFDRIMLRNIGIVPCLDIHLFFSVIRINLDILKTTPVHILLLYFDASFRGSGLNQSN